MEKQAHVSEYKKELVKKLVDSINHYPVVASLDLENMPAPQLQKMRAQLRGTVDIVMTKRRLMKIALEQAKGSKKGIEKLIPHLSGMPALMFTKESPFKLSKILKKSRSPAPAKAGQTAPRDIIVPKGPTPFAPGPIISELSMAGIKAGVEGGKVAVKEDSVVAKKGEKISAKAAALLTRFGIMPMEIGLTLTAAYEGGIVYDRGILDIDEKSALEKLSQASASAINLAVYAAYPAKDTIGILLSKAVNDAKALGISQNIIDDGVIDVLLAKAEASMLSLKSAAGIEAVEKPKKENNPIETELEKKEERALKREKNIIKEETKLEKKENKGITPFDNEVQHGVKEEEEKQLENERIDAEKEIDSIEKEKHKTDDVHKVEGLVEELKKKGTLRK